MLAGIETSGSAAGFVAPDDLVHEVVWAEDIVQHQSELGAHAPIDMQVQAASGGKEGMAAGEDGTHPFEVFRLGHVVPEEGYPALLVLVALALEGIPRAEGRIEVDQLDFPLVFFDQFRKELFRTGQEEGTGSADLMMLRLAIDPHPSFLRYLIILYYNTRCWAG